jgi:hypothetical protein
MQQNVAIALEFKGNLIGVRQDAVNLTDMWKAAGANPSKQPWAWARHKETRAVLAALQDLSQKQVLIQAEKKRRGGATWATEEVAIAYGMYLRPDFHAWCLTTLKNFFRTGALARHVPETPKVDGSPWARVRGGVLEPVVRREMQRTAVATKQSIQRVIGFVRRHAHVPSPYEMAVADWDGIQKLLEDLAMGRLQFPALARGPQPPKAVDTRQQQLWSSN